MKRVTFRDDADASAVVAALRIAAEQYKKDADAAADSEVSEPARGRIAAQFRTQATKALSIASDIERDAL